LTSKLNVEGKSSKFITLSLQFFIE
jgi:hypothetical protein